MHSLVPVSAPGVLTGNALAEATEHVAGWGMAVGGQARVLRPTSIDGVRAALELARSSGTRVALRGSGCSYGDAACGTGKIVIDFSKLNQVLAWDPQTGRIRCEAGATIRDVWQKSLPDGWWPPVVSGTMAPTLGGAVAMNIHGKNAYRVGTIGEHVTSLTVLFAHGEVRTLTPDADSDLFHAIVGGMGELGLIVEVELQLKRVYSGQLEVLAVAARDLDEMFALFEQHEAGSDYLVGWIDGFATGKGLGRGAIHVAYQLAEGADPDRARTLSLDAQALPSRMLGVVPKSWMWALMKPFSNDLGMRLINAAKYIAGVLQNGKRYRQGHAAFHFLLDYVPNWKWIYRPGGLVQHQSFVPRDNARAAFAEILRLTHEHGLPTWLAVMKRHRPDPFLLTHGLDGYSLAMDIAVTPEKRERVWALCHALDRVVVKNGGRFYFAKDATLEPESVAAAFPHDKLMHFAELREKLDPEGLLATDLYDRVLGPALALARAASAPPSR